MSQLKIEIIILFSNHKYEIYLQDCIIVNNAVMRWYYKHKFLS